MSTGRAEKMRFLLLGNKYELQSLLYFRSPPLFHGLTLVSKVFKKLVSVFGEHHVKTQYVRSLCQERVTFFNFPTEAMPIPAAARFKASVCVVRLLGLQVRITPGKWMSVCCE